MTSATPTGAPRSEDHDRYLLALGRATYEAARLATMCFDLLRVHGEIESQELYEDPLGRLQQKLEALNRAKPGFPHMSDFLDTLNGARESRNDLLHALAVADGLYRRRSKDSYYVRQFFDEHELDLARLEMERAIRLGSEVLYHDGGAAISAWYARLCAP